MDTGFSVMYINAPTDGSSKRRLESFEENVQLNHAAKAGHGRSVRNARRQQRRSRTADMLSVLAMGTACIMLVVMVVGLVRLGTVNSDANWMETYVAALQEENDHLRAQYREGYDLEEIRREAEDMGLVPVDQLQQITISAERAQEQPEPSVWERMGMFLAGLFA